MNRIKVLPENLANQIAAGEVVERPASVIKELVENAIDAEARRIRVDVELGGRRLMRISDDGTGMLRDDAILAFERHATSKIRTLEDLAAIGTLGFRGEALASIASVAKVELVSRPETENAATLVLVEGGKLIDVRQAPRDAGTTISVRDLFYNTPARRKFMRSEATENYHLTSIITHYALAHPEIAFTVTNNGREVLRVAPAKNLRERAFQLFGGGLLDSLLPVEGGRENFIKVDGFVSAPRERRSTKDGQYFFVNQRYVRDKTIAAGLIEGYRSVLPHGVYPVAFLFIEIPVDEIDVNVHPAKTEIRFRRTEAVKEIIAEAVKASLARAGIIANTARKESVDVAVPPVPISQNPFEFARAGDRLVGDKFEPEPPRPMHVPDEPRIDVGNGSSRGFETAGTYDEFSLARDFEQIARDRSLAGGGAVDENFGESAGAPAGLQAVDITPTLPPANSAVRAAKPAEVAELSAGKIKPIAQLHDSFIIAVDDEGLLLIDQHVAHERILFDKFSKSESERGIESQNLLLPETFDLSPAQAEAFNLIETDIQSLGFGVMRLSGRTIAIKSIPTDLPVSEARNLFAEMLDAVDPEKRGGAKAMLRADIAASLACKAAIKINMKLTPEKMHWLIDRLLLTTSPTTCPHGRPVVLRLSMKDIERGFHRS